MKTVILAGGLGTRISEESHLRPKPMVEVGELPILWHIMKIYSHYGFNEFVVCAGYKQNIIKEFFADYYIRTSEVTFDFSNGGDLTIHNSESEPWKVTVADTGRNTMTGGRIKRVRHHIEDETFMLTYGDGVADIDIPALLETHRKRGRLATLTGVNVSQRFGVLDIKENGDIVSFREKKRDDHAIINGGFMVLEPEVLSYIEGDDTIFEQEPLEALARNGELTAYHHKGFWQCLDTQRDKTQLEDMWSVGAAPWKLW